MPALDDDITGPDRTDRSYSKDRVSMAKEYIEERDGNYYVAGTRISLDSIAHAFRCGESPETICQNFELLRLEEVYGAIAYYLANQADIDTSATQELAKFCQVFGCVVTKDPMHREI